MSRTLGLMMVLGITLAATGATRLFADDPTTPPQWPSYPYLPPEPGTPAATQVCVLAYDNCMTFPVGICASTVGDGYLDHCSFGLSTVGTAGVKIYDKKALGKCQTPSEGNGPGCTETLNPACAIVELYEARIYTGPPNLPENYHCSVLRCYKLIQANGSYCYP